MKRGVAGGQQLFSTTDWVQVKAVAHADADQAFKALEGIVQRYYRPLQVHLRSKFCVPEDQAADWLQEFVLRKVLLGELVKRASRERGKFRTFLLFALDRFVISELRREHAQSRRPEHGLESLEGLGAEVASVTAASGAGDMVADWARIVIEQTLARMEAECLQKGCANRWGVFKVRRLDPLFEGAEPLPYDELVRQYEFRSPAEAANAFMTATRMFRRLLREVVAEYAGEGADAEDEIRELRRELGRLR
jgi:RNA polymerase sigma-70 factor (ECF subfamily)